MTTRTPVACGRPGCPYPLAPHNHVARAAAVEHDQYRGNATSRGYDSTWRRIAKAYLRANPWCRHCKAQGHLVQAALVDHIKPVAEGGTSEDTNLQPLCRRCHAIKTSKEKR